MVGMVAAMAAQLIPVSTIISEGVGGVVPAGPTVTDSMSAGGFADSPSCSRNLSLPSSRPLRMSRKGLVTRSQQPGLGSHLTSPAGGLPGSQITTNRTRHHQRKKRIALLFSHEGPKKYPRVTLPRAVDVDKLSDKLNPLLCVSVTQEKPFFAPRRPSKELARSNSCNSIPTHTAQFAETVGGVVGPWPAGRITGEKRVVKPRAMRAMEMPETTTTTILSKDTWRNEWLEEEEESVFSISSLRLLPSLSTHRSIEWPDSRTEDDRLSSSSSSSSIATSSSSSPSPRLPSFSLPYSSKLAMVEIVSRREEEEEDEGKEGGNCTDGRSLRRSFADLRLEVEEQLLEEEEDDHVFFPGTSTFNDANHLCQSYIFSQFSSAVQSSPPPRQKQESAQKDDYYVNVGDAIRTLRDELPSLFYKEMTWDIYRENIVFSDPFNQIEGIRNYRTIFWALRFQGRIFFKVLWVDVLRIWQPCDKVIMVRWTVRGVPRVPWESNGHFDGTSEYKLDDNGKIYAHKVDNVVMGPRFKPRTVMELVQIAARTSTPNPTYFFRRVATSLGNLLPYLKSFTWVRFYLALRGTLAIREEFPEAEA